MVEIVTASEVETRALGERLGRLLQAGDFVTLSGELGAGKTQFTKGIAGGLEVASARYLASPTYTIMNQYQGRVPLYHFDLYRLRGEGDVTDLGLDEYFAGDGVAVVEWPDRLGGELPTERLDVAIEYLDDERRRVRLEGVSARYQRVLQQLAPPK